MSKSQKNKPLLPENLEKIKILLELLNNKSEYITETEIKNELKDDFDLNVLHYAVGFPNELGWSTKYIQQRTQYLANLAIITEHKLIQEWSHPNGTKYKITLKGIAVLNDLRTSEFSKRLLTSSKRLEILSLALIILTGFLIVYSIISISIVCNSNTICYAYHLEIGSWMVISIALIILILCFMYLKLNSKWNKD